MKKFELSIPKPCHENWEAMSPDQKGRFCGSCQKTVVDFTLMSDRQIAEFFKKPSGSVCGRFGDDQLNRIIEVPRKRIPWVKYFFTIALPAFLLSFKASGQEKRRLMGKIAVREKPVLKGDTVIHCAPASGAASLTALQGTVGMVVSKPGEQRSPEEFSVSGRVTDENNKPLAFASVQLGNTNCGIMTDSLGNFLIKTNQHKGTIQVSFVGFDLQQISYSGDSFFAVILKENRRELMGELIVMPVKKKPISITSSQKKDTILSAFSVFPNPVTAGAFINLLPKNMEEGRYILSLLTSKGETVQMTELLIDKKIKQVSIKLNKVPAAPYFLQLTSKKTNKSYSEVILVQ